VIARHPYRAVGGVLAVMAVCVFVSGMVGQFNEGPWGGLPKWVGALTWFGFLGTVLVMLVLSAYLAVAHVRYRKAVR
jgi:fructose-specific phosphotransferase system IIC component